MPLQQIKPQYIDLTQSLGNVTVANLTVTSIYSDNYNFANAAPFTSGGGGAGGGISIARAYFMAGG